MPMSARSIMEADHSYEWSFRNVVEEVGFLLRRRMIGPDAPADARRPRSSPGTSVPRWG
jgi:hypothetical protein